MVRKTAVTRIAQWGRIAAPTVAAAAVWTAAGVAQEKEEKSHRVVRYYQNETGPRPILGVYLGEADQGGLRVIWVMEDWPAEGAGIRKDDIIVRINGHELAEPLEDEAEPGLPATGPLLERRLRALLREVPEGESVEVTVRRGGETLDVAVVPQAWPTRDTFTIWPGEGTMALIEHADRLRELGARVPTIETMPERLLSLTSSSPAGSYRFRLDGRWQGGHGLDLLELNPELGSYFGTDEGVLVADVDDDSTLG